ncbi:MAG: peptide chain release factor N(5)-glutamine methyltransferase [Syntrophus sp. (in: bacteria)]|nr:peptide chain release factor N(5)-glutamine methyltransferase [Syntrophus sp. (in: bacteria)]
MRIKDIAAQSGKVEGLDIINIFSFVLSMKKEEILMNPEREIEAEKARSIERLLEERRCGKPLAYILGEKEFFSHPFLVDQRVLIPRPDTELLVEEALAILDKNPLMGAIMDMGTGSGIIGGTIARIAEKHVLCVDISRDALSVAEKNSRTAGVSGRLSFLCSDLFAGIKRETKYDMIAANLPYVAQGEWDSLMKDVREYEPRLALLGGGDGLDIYRRFTADLPDYLKDDGYVLCEIGGEEQAIKMAHLFESRGLRTAIKRDLSHRERVIIGSWTSLL